MSRLLGHSLFRLASRGLSSGSSRIFVKFLHCFFCHFGQFSLTLGPFIGKFFTSYDARGISNLARCQWRSWAWRVYSEFLHVIGCNIAIFPPFSGPSPLNLLNAHFVLILRFFRRCAVPCIDVLMDFKIRVDF